MNQPGADQQWWRGATVYQVYLRSFADGNGDGIGDLAGLRSRLGHVKDLGVDALWINPWYPSPMADGGYDVSDYRDIDPVFGSLSDGEALIADAHRAGLRVLLDIVPNHTSDRHPWFVAALEDGPGSESRARYHFRDGRGEFGELPPNDWNSCFGGPAWTRVKEPDGTAGQWYLHLFAGEQPDLNWSRDDVRAEFESILRFWFDRGVDGFRIDVAHLLLKDPAMPDVGDDSHAGSITPRSDLPHPYIDNPGLRDIYRSWRTIADGYPEPKTFVAEAWVGAPHRLARFLAPGQLHNAFSDIFLNLPWDKSVLQAGVAAEIEGLAAVGAHPTWVASSHDSVRHLTRYQQQALHGDELGPDAGVRRARAAALLLTALPGSFYLYQGEELGLPEVQNLPAEVLQDPRWARSGGTDPGRDGCRVPLPWHGSEPPYGFTTGATDGAPWLPQPAEWAELSVARAVADPGSMLALYRTALTIRKAHPALGIGTITWLDRGPRVMAFRRDPGFTCVVNFGDHPVELPSGELLLSSGPLIGRLLPTDTTAWLNTVGQAPTASTERQHDGPQEE